MPFGILDSQYIDFPAGIDEQYLRGLRTRAGVDFPELVAQIDGMLGELNGGLDPQIANLISVTTDPTNDNTAPVAFTVERATEYTIARPQFVEGAAHMLPLNKWDVTLGFTEDGLEAMSLNRIVTNIQSVLLGYRKLYRLEALTRLFSDAEVRVDRKTSVTSPGFAGSGTGDNVFIGPYPNGAALPGGYTHYFRDTAANRAALALTMRDRLKKWWPGPYDLIGSASEVAALAAINPGDPVNGFVPAGSPLVRGDQTAAEARLDPDLYVGILFGDIRVQKPVDDFTDANFAIFKSFGPLAPGNPLAWRYDEQKGRNAYIRTRTLYPLADATLIQWFGVGVGNRTAALLARIAASGSYVAPTIS